MTGYESKKAAAQAKLAPNNETLIKRLRDTASRGVSVWGDLMLEAADALEQPVQERNFCPRCGKRTADLTVIHTCTPLQEKKHMKEDQTTAIANAIVRAAELLGNNGAATNMGAIEAHSVKIAEALNRIADAIFKLAEVNEGRE